MSGGFDPDGHRLSRYDDNSRQLDWRARQQIERMKDEAAVSDAAQEVAANREAREIELSLTNGKILASQAMQHVGELHHEARRIIQGDRDAEYTCREILSVYALASAQAIGRYMTRGPR